MNLKSFFIALLTLVCTSSAFAYSPNDKGGLGPRFPPSYIRSMPVAASQDVIQNGYLQVQTDGFSGTISIAISEQTGNIVANYSSEENGEVYVGDLPQGSYIAVYTNDEGVVLNSVTFVID